MLSLPKVHYCLWIPVLVSCCHQSLESCIARGFVSPFLLPPQVSVVPACVSQRGVLCMFLPFFQQQNVVACYFVHITSWEHSMLSVFSVQYQSQVWHQKHKEETKKNRKIIIYENKHFCASKDIIMKLKENPQNERKYMKIIYLIMNLCTKYIKIILQQQKDNTHLKMGRGPE